MENCSIVISTLNREKTLCDTLKSLKDCIDYTRINHEELLVEVIIVDQTISHERKTIETLERFVEQVNSKILHSSVQNLPNARNMGIEQSQYNIIIFIDDDVILTRDFIYEHCKMYENESVFGVAGRIELCDQRGKMEKKGLSYVKRIARELLLSLAGRDKACLITETGVVLSDFTKNKHLNTDGVRGCNMSFRKEVFETVGMFDINYEGNAIREETDLCLRMNKAGLKLAFNPKAEMKHVMSISGGTRSDNCNYWQTFFDNQVYYFYKNFGLKERQIKNRLFFDIYKCKKMGLDAENMLNNGIMRAKRLVDNKE